MTKISMKLFALVLAIFMYQGVSAQDDVLYEETFSEDLGSFEVEGYNGYSTNIWTWDKTEKCAKGDAYDMPGMDEEIVNYLVSSMVFLENDSYVASFEQKNKYFGDLSQIGFFIREYGGEWEELSIPFCPENKDEFIGVGNIVIPDSYKGKTVEFGFKYSTPNKNKAGSWFIKNFIVKTNSGSDADKSDPQISFSESEVQGVLGDPFKSPVLDNPNEVEVSYSSEKPEVATVDPVTGEVTLVGVGTTTISATNVEDGKFYSATVSYVLTVLGHEASKIIYHQEFTNDLGDFYVEGFNGANDDIWAYQEGSAIADAYHKLESRTSTYLVSGNITLDEGNTAVIEYASELFANEKIEEEIVFSIREVGGEWEDLVMPVCKNSSDFISSGDIIIPASYNGKTVQVAFKYTSDGGASSGVWRVKSIILKKGYDKVDPQIAFDVKEVNYILGTEFKAPVLINPNGVEVTYKSSDTTVATVDAKTGAVKVLSEGSTTISAVSVENNTYYSNTAKYVLTVSSGNTFNIVYEESFATDFGGFYIDGYNGDEDDIWSHSDKDAYAMADAYKKVDTKTDFYLVSEDIKLGNDNTAEFEYNAELFAPENIEHEIMFSIREAGGEWKDMKLPVCVNKSKFISSGIISIPSSYNGKTVQVAFKYVSDGGASSGVWKIRNFVIKSAIEKEDAQIAYDTKEMTYTMGTEFKAPVLSNPNGLDVKYSSSDETVAVVSEEGAVTVLAEGVTTIKAVSEATDKFNAGEASYVLTVVKGVERAILFEEHFDEENLCSFHVEGDNGPEDNPIWNWDTYCHSVRADAYYKFEGIDYESYLVSPAIELGTDNIITFDHLTEYFTNLNDLAVCVREAGSTTWTKISEKFAEAVPMANAGDIAVPTDFDGKSVEFGFRYRAADSQSAGIWGIDNVIVKGIKGGASEKKDPQISFPKDEYVYVIGTGDFNAPVVNNPNNVKVVYSSSNTEMADVDAESGFVMMYDLGSVEIIATSVETEEFKSVSVSYTLIITDTPPAGIDSIFADDLKNGKVYDIQGRRVNKLGKGLYIVNGKKVVIK